jgi:hypothetical protein
MGAALPTQAEQLDGNEEFMNDMILGIDNQNETVVDHRTTEDVAYAIHEAAAFATWLGAASELWKCPECRTKQGVERVVTRMPTNTNAFDGGDAIKLRCGHWLI